MDSPRRSSPCRTNEFPCYERIYEDVQSLSTLLDQACPGEHFPVKMKTYPSSASELPADLWAQAYSEDDPPVTLTMPRVAVIAQNHVPLRNTSRLLVHKPLGPGSGQRQAMGAMTWSGYARPVCPEPRQRSMLALEDMSSPAARGQAESPLPSHLAICDREQGTGAAGLQWKPQVRHQGRTPLPAADASAASAALQQPADPKATVPAATRPAPTEVAVKTEPELAVPTAKTVGEETEAQALNALLARDKKKNKDKSKKDKEKRRNERRKAARAVEKAKRDHEKKRKAGDGAGTSSSDGSDSESELPPRKRDKGAKGPKSGRGRNADKGGKGGKTRKEGRDVGKGPKGSSTQQGVRKRPAAHKKK